MNFRQMLKRNEFYIFLLVILFSIAVTLKNPVFASPANLLSLLKTSSGSAVFAVGILIVLVSGGFDVSSTSIAICAQYITVNLIIHRGWDHIAVAFLVAALLGACMGAVNAVFVAFFRLPTLIVTLGTASLFHGALLEFVGTKAVNLGDLPQCFKTFGLVSLWPKGPSALFGILCLVLAVSWAILRHTMSGRGIYAIGGDLEAARNSGFRVKRIQFFIYCYVGLLAGIAGSTALVCAANFALGRVIGGREFGREASQALGQKNTTFTIWLALTYASPLVALGPTCYVLWHNLWNSWQLHQAGKVVEPPR